MNYLFKRNVKEAEELAQRLAEDNEAISQAMKYNPNEPAPRLNHAKLRTFIDDIFAIAVRELSPADITSMVSLWVKQEQIRFLNMAAERRDISLGELDDALHRFALIPDGFKCFSPEEGTGVRVALIRRLFSDNLDFINVLKKVAGFNDLRDVLKRTIGPAKGNGKLGGKAAGLFRAQMILQAALAAQSDHIVLRNLTVPKTWYLTSDGLINFLHFNALEEISSIKYRNTSEIRKEFFYLEQIFKNSTLSPEMIAKLGTVLDDMGDRPLVVRSSSLLEDSAGSSFAGKYKSLFVANQGSKKDRLAALIDAIVEVYASVFHPDPIEYRRERGLLDFHEEMGVLIQEVVGKRVGKYYFPAIAGVAFSLNEFRWSNRLRRNDGIVRFVTGLGTRAVDRVGDDYPMLVSPGQPGLRVNVTPEDILWYSQKKIDVINLETKRFESMDVRQLLNEVGRDFPALHMVFSMYRDGQIAPTVGSLINLKDGEPVITFANLMERSPFLPAMRTLLRILENAIGAPVDIEFAFEEDVHRPVLLQCRPQSQGGGSGTVKVPTDVAPSDKIFSASRFVTTGLVEDIDYIVYVDSDQYDSLPTMNDLTQVGRVVGELNAALPARRFILVGPGRWGSRGDIKLGVKVGYSDINNTAMLIEVGQNRQGYVPDLSFGTHFFQDLVEAGIRYLPLYPDDPGVIFNWEFLKQAPSVMRKFSPRAGKGLDDVVRVIQVSKAAGGALLTVAMDGESDNALAYLDRRKRAD